MCIAGHFIDIFILDLLEFFVQILDVLERLSLFPFEAVERVLVENPDPCLQELLVLDQGVGDEPLLDVREVTQVLLDVVLLDLVQEAFVHGDGDAVSFEPTESVNVSEVLPIGVGRERVAVFRIQLDSALVDDVDSL